MNVPMLDLRVQYAAIKSEVDAAVMAVLESQQFRGGPVLEEFEKSLASFAGVKHAVGVGSGSDALLLALKALHLQSGDEVITTPFSFFATAGAIVNAGGIPVFADICPDTFNMDPACIESLITKRTRAILPVHIFGQCADMEDIRKISVDRGLLIVEDMAQALGARRGDSSAGAWGDAAACSFYPTKNLGAAGEGGAVLTNSDETAQHIRLLRCHGASALYEHAIVGVNSHLHTLQAAVLNVKLRYLEQWNTARRERAQYYTQHLASVPEIKVPVEQVGCHHVYHQYVIRVSERDQVRQRLIDRNIGCGVFYPTPLHLQPCFMQYAGTGDVCVNAEQACKEVLALPLYPELPASHQDLVIDALLEHTKKM
ncbi:MAG: DegT/DnrJ/EryC1/StrS family aminotransferase [Candidatus Hydrogenedentes bacterium]|nr:DegT/DnrJ/EryC1/StrS family aminotransferase [Candidatus Hydrogenedentota bacterium]